MTTSAKSKTLYTTPFHNQPLSVVSKRRRRFQLHTNRTLSLFLSLVAQPFGLIDRIKPPKSTTILSVPPSNFPDVRRRTSRRIRPPAGCGPCNSWRRNPVQDEPPQQDEQVHFQELLRCKFYCSASPFK